MFVPFSQRGKDWEPKALALRRLAGVGMNGSLLDPWVLAPKVGLLVVEATEELLNTLPESSRTQLLDGASSKWSGGVLPAPLPDGKRICILNPRHSYGRNKITLMEEIAHIHLAHSPTKLVFEGDGLKVRDFNDHQEEEAYGVGAAVLLPWQSFFHFVNDGSSRADIARHYEVTEQLVDYRLKICGAYKLYRARQRSA